MNSFLFFDFFIKILYNIYNKRRKGNNIISMSRYKTVWKCIACNKWYGDGLYPYTVCPKCGAQLLTIDVNGKLKYINKNVKLVTAKKQFFRYIELEDKNEKK